MAAIETWVRQLVLIVLFAGITELILPQSALRQYTRMALGLVVLLSILSPALDLLDVGVRWSDQEMTSLLTAAGADEDLSILLQRGEQLAQENEARAAESFRRRLELQAGELARRWPEVASAQARVALEERPESANFGAVTGVTLELYLQEVTEEEAAGPVTLVDPITIAPVRVGDEDNGPEASSESPNADALRREGSRPGYTAVERQVLAGEIRRQMAAAFGVALPDVEIHFPQYETGAR